MPIFSPKTGPIFTRGRLQHAILGALCPLLGGALTLTLGGTFYEGVSLGAVSMSVIAGAWETSTGALARKNGWTHPWGDLLDFLAFQSGIWVVGIPVGVAGALGG